MVDKVTLTCQPRLIRRLTIAGAVASFDRVATTTSRELGRVAIAPSFQLD
ncbi:MAG TPA: hypothetical protein V6D14_21585 [Coleofasciculaceae cyanobacterium]